MLRAIGRLVNPSVYLVAGVRTVTRTMNGREASKSCRARSLFQYLQICVEKLLTFDQISAGGVAFRRRKNETEVAIVSVLPTRRWQLPKGIVDEGESAEAAAIREVREEAGLETELLAPIETIEYWYVGDRRGQGRVRYHKFVHFFLLEYRGGQVSDHDQEVAEARWVAIEEATRMLAFKGERAVVEKAREMIASL